MALLVSGVTMIIVIETSNIKWLNSLLVWTLVIISIPLLLLYTLQGVLLLWNAFTVWRKESHTLGNMLTLGLGIMVIVVLPLMRAIDQDLFSKNSVTLYNAFVVPVIFYLVFCFLAFITSFLITRLYRPHYDRDYTIVLGAGLLDGDQVSPLLASRIQRALDFAAAQEKKTGQYPWLIFSGGQGGDETIPEGVAMSQYALAHGAHPDKCLAEKKSQNTYENMAFSKKILTRKQIDLNKGLFSTSDYHTFRAAGYARYVGLHIDGIGAKTSNFFIPNAFLREYIALMANHKKAHLIAILLILLVSAVNFLVGNGLQLF